MKNVAPKLHQKDYDANFEEIHPAFTENSARAEANRCLYCYDSPCTQACPTHIDIPAFIKKIASENDLGSAKTILQSNWIGLTCAKACPVEILCEGACVYNARHEQPIQIGRLQRFALDRYFESGMPPLFAPAKQNGKSVGVIGGGPAGLACGAELALLGYGVTVYEAKSTAGGLDTWGIAPYKMTQDDSRKEVELVRSLGVEVRTCVRVGVDVTVQELISRHDALFIGTGLPKPSSLRIPGEDLEGVVHALEFIERVTTRRWRKVDVGRKVVVIGGGNTAIDAATEAKRLGAQEVTIMYRRSKREMSAYNFEQELAKSDGVRFLFQTAPKRILGKRSVEAIECVRMKLGKRDARGRPRPQEIPRSKFTTAADMVILSVGQSVEHSFLSEIPGVKIHEGMVVVDPETYQTTHPKFFAGGDCINGGKEVVNAAHDGKHAARGIHLVLRGEGRSSETAG